jgi:hypothetical protein
MCIHTLCFSATDVVLAHSAQRTQQSAISTPYPVQRNQHSAASTAHPAERNQYSAPSTAQSVQRTQNSAISTAHPAQRNQYSAPSTATNLQAGSPISSRCNKPFPETSRQPLGSTQIPLQCGQLYLSTEIKHPGREADHSPPIWYTH